MNDTIIRGAALIIPLIFAIVFHEVAHGLMAKLLGDPTAEEQNRLSLNPLRHVDPVGTVILPGILALLKAPVFGWAKPVPVNKWRLRNPRRDMMLVAAAGPGINLVMAAFAAVLIGLMMPDVAQQVQGLAALDAGLAAMSPMRAFLMAALMYFLTINVFLALFNLLPIPPFDGSHIVEGLLPRPFAEAYAKLRRFGFALFFVLLFIMPKVIPGFDIIGKFVAPPVEWLIGHYLDLAAAIAG